jgi:hypothetical protein
MYNQRNKLDPFWNTLVLGGVKNGVKYLGSVRVENSTKMTAMSNCFTKHCTPLLLLCECLPNPQLTI